ncbi:MAG: right-handed parallel beta-helix repeat-containing protein [Candidatus Heimdallarchaeota archaeon]|nr:right-handed parallel beta-helix repeat-containing protein [Candidatus Heimdallarchaeota archaeon]
MQGSQKRNKIIMITIVIIVGLVIASLISYFAVIFYKFLSTPLEGVTIYKNIIYLEDFESNGFEGSGTDSDPFILENEFIDVDYFIGIYIGGADASITIRNCTFSNQLDNGIDIERVTGNVSIHNNTFLCSSGAIFVNEVNTISIFDNHFTKSVSVYDSNEPMIVNNIFDMNKADSFFIVGTPNASITDNRFYNCGMTILEDNITNIESWEIDDNMVNNRPILVLRGEENSTLNGGIFGQIIGVGCKNITLKGIELEESGKAINLINSQNCSITNCIITNSLTGIGLHYGSDISIVNNTGINCSYGIESTNAIRTIISDNTFTNCIEGIYVYGPINRDHSEACSIINNVCEEGQIGLSIRSDYCQILYNILRENELHGIAVSGYSNLIHHNILIDNNPRGKSQANDNGDENLWYDSSSMEGNLWSDWSGRGSYSVDGSAESEDIYPMSVEGGAKLLDVGEIVAISLSSVLGLGAIVFGIYFGLKKRKENKLKG